MGRGDVVRKYRFPKLPLRPPGNQVANFKLRTGQERPSPTPPAPAPLPATSPISNHPGLPAGPAPWKREGQPRPRPKGNLEDPHSSCHGTLKARSPRNSKLNTQGETPSLLHDCGGWGGAPRGDPTHQAPFHPPQKNNPTQKRTKTTLSCLIVTVYPGIILKQL